jgi:hypothetical protein
VVAEAGKQMSTIGIVEVDIKLGNEKFTWSVYVAPIGDSVLLGILFQYLIRYDFLLYVSRYILTHLFDITLLE